MGAAETQATQQTCSWCQLRKPADHFYFVTKKTGIRRGQCKPCMRVIKKHQRDPEWRPPCVRCGVTLETKRSSGRRLCPACLTIAYGNELRPSGSHRRKLAPCAQCGGPKTERFRLGRLCEKCSPWRNGNPPDIDLARDLWQNFGLTIAQYERMYEMSNGTCWICGRPPKKRRLSVEHDHGPSKRVRGLACDHCNQYRLGTNTLETARKVVEYLESSFDGRDL